MDVIIHNVNETNGWNRALGRLLKVPIQQCGITLDQLSRVISMLFTEALPFSRRINVVGLVGRVAAGADDVME